MSYRINALVTAVLLVAARLSIAQVANDNPTGTAGDFNGDVTTGCRFDGYTGNAKRSVTDIIVAGGVGAYPLEFTRTANSRYIAGVQQDLGSGGPWSHSYQWSVDTSSNSTANTPTHFTVNYPDGRRVNFKPSSMESNASYFRGPAGVRDRVQFIKDSSTAGRLWLLMPDGGKVFFTVQISGNANRSYAIFIYTLQSIIDPSGQTTTITGSIYPDYLITVTEPAGRWLQLYYDPSTFLLDHVTASDGRTVQYHYVNNSQLSSVSYWDSGLTASYTYSSTAVQDMNGDTNHPLATCDDPFYAGPMRRIAYTYATGNNADGTKTIPGQIKSENYWDGTFSSTGAPNVGVAVSTLDITGTNIRKETRGDNPTGSGNPTRTFTYSKALLASWTDFKGCLRPKRTTPPRAT